MTSLRRARGAGESSFSLISTHLPRTGDKRSFVTLPFIYMLLFAFLAQKNQFRKTVSSVIFIINSYTLSKTILLIIINVRQHYLL